MQDTTGNIIYRLNNTLFIQLKNEKVPRKIGVINVEEKTLIIKRIENIHLFLKNNSYGFNYTVLSTATTFDKVKLIEKTTAETNEYVIPLEEILKKGDFLNFKQQGFELQIFLKKEIIEQWKRN